MKRLFPNWIYWGLLLPLVLLNVWAALLILTYLQSILVIFATATLFSFILNYPVRLLQRQRLSRNLSIFIILMIGVGLCLLLGVTLIPALIGQLNDLVTYLPSWIRSGSDQLQSIQGWINHQGWSLDLSHWIGQLEEKLSAQLQLWSGQILDVFVGTVGGLFELVLTVVVTFYLLLYGDRIRDGILQWFPEPKGKQIHGILRQNFHNYLVGQFTVGLLMGVSMTLAFVIMQIPFGVLFGTGIGLLAIFPFGTPLGIAITSFLVALKSFWIGIRVLVIALIIDQSIENFVAPQLLSKFTGLNPVWVLAALLLGTKIGGVLGLVTAVPFAGFLKNIADLYKTRRS